MTGIAGPAGGGVSGAAILRLVAVSAVVAFAVTIVGGEWLGWTWTGFADNNTVWDWLHLLVLPAVLTAAPVWYSTRRSARAEWRFLLGAVAIAFVVLVTAGYGFHWQWTGFPGNTLWDWMHLLLVPFVLPVALAWLSTRVEHADEQAQVSSETQTAAR